MALNERIKQEYGQKYKGKFGRKVLRNMAKAEIAKEKAGQQAFFGILKPRQERKERARKLMIPFKRFYNGPVFNVKRELVPNEKGYLKLVVKDIVEVRQ